MNDGFETLTIRELSARLNISFEAARGRAKRSIRSGKWQEAPRNDQSAALRVIVPVADLAGVTGRGERLGGTPPDGRGERSPPLTPTVQGERDEAVAALRDLLSEREARVVELTERLVQSEATLADLKARTEMSECSLRSQVDELESIVDQLRTRGWIDRLLRR